MPAQSSRTGVVDDAAGPDRADHHIGAGLLGLHHLPVADVERHVVDTAAGGPEQHVPGALLGQRHPLAPLGLVAAVVRQRDSDAGERVDHQAGAVKPDLAVVAVGVAPSTVADATGGTLAVAATPGIGDAELGQRALDDDGHRVAADSGLRRTRPARAPLRRVGLVGSRCRCRRGRPSGILGGLRRQPLGVPVPLPLQALDLGLCLGELPLQHGLLRADLLEPALLVVLGGDGSVVGGVGDPRGVLGGGLRASRLGQRRPRDGFLVDLVGAGPRQVIEHVKLRAC